MAVNDNLREAKKKKKDEFFTAYEVIEAEMNSYYEYDKNAFRGKTILLPCDDPEWSNFTKYFAANFERFGLKKLISTSFAKSVWNKQLTDFEKSSPAFDNDKRNNNGKLFILEKDTNNSGHIDHEDIEFSYLCGDGDFRSEEVTKLRDEADIIITNPPFSLFRDFLAWINEANKQFIIIGNLNALTYKEVFPLIKNNSIWLGPSIHSGDRKFYVPDTYPLDAAGCGVDGEGKRYIKVKGVRWYTNIEYGNRHDFMPLMTYDENIKYNKKLINRCKKDYEGSIYQKYYNYDAIEVPVSEAIPKDYYGVMGVPISFMDKYCPEQFEILGLGIANLGLECGVQPYTPEHKEYRKNVQHKGQVNGDLYLIDSEGHPVVPYARILIKAKGELK